MAFAAHQFRLARRMPDGQMERVHLQAAAAGGDPRAKAELAGPACPAGAEYLWGWFLALDGARGSNGFGLNPLSYSELEAYARLQGVQMSAHEADALRALDHKRLELAAEDPKHGRAQG